MPIQPDANEEKESEKELEPNAGTPEAHSRNTPVLTRLQDLAETLLLFQYSYHELTNVSVDTHGEGNLILGGYLKSVLMPINILCRLKVSKFPTCSHYFPYNFHYTGGIFSS